MDEILYHGSVRIIEKPVFGYGKPYNDYGLGFYCTKDHDLAGEWAVSLGNDGYINKYRLNTEDLRILNLNGPDHCILDWLEVLLENRRFDIQSDFGYEAIRYLHENFGSEIEKFDVITGYRADDSYFSFAQDFLNNIISLSTLSDAMHIGNLGEQTMLKSPRAFEKLEYIGSDKVRSAIFYPKKENRDRSARNDYRSLKQRPWKKGEIYMMQIIDRGLTKNDLFI